MQLEIIGAGLTGPLLAAYCARRGHEVTLLEGRRDLRTEGPRVGRSINLTLAERGWLGLRGVGWDQRVRPLAVACYGRAIHTDGEVRFQPYGSRGEAIYSVQRGELASELLTAAEEEPNVRVAFGARCAGVDPSAGELELLSESGAKTRRRVGPVFATDGVFSATHALQAKGLLRVDRRTVHVGYKELRLPARSDGTSPLEHHALHIWPRGHFVLIAFPNTDNSLSVSLFLPGTGEHPSFESLGSERDVESFFEQHFPDALRVMPTLTEDFFANPAAKLHTLQLDRWAFDDRLLIMGDAAHAMVPFLGQGLNCCFEDCRILDECMGRNGSDFGKTFAEFERLRRLDCDAVGALALRHFHELSEKIRDDDFLRRARLEQQLYERYPDKFAPFYSMVSFTHLSYRHIRKLAARTDEVVSRLMELKDGEHDWDAPHPRLQELLDQSS